MTAKFDGGSFDGFSTILITSPIPLSIFSNSETPLFDNN